MLCIKGLSRDDCQEHPSLWNLRGRPGLDWQISQLRRALPGEDLCFVLHGENPALAAWLRENGIDVVQRFSDTFAASFKARMADQQFLLVVGAYAPFVSGEIVTRALRRFTRTGMDVMTFAGLETGIVPEMLVTARAARAIADQDLAQRFFATLTDENRSIAREEYADPCVALFSRLVGTIAARSRHEIQQALDTLDLGPDGIDAAMRGYFSARRNALQGSFETGGWQGAQDSGRARQQNEDLALLEAFFQQSELTAYPVHFALNLYPRCTAHCTFCGYYTAPVGSFRVEASRLKQLDWLALTQRLQLNGGLGEPFAHPDIVNLLYRIQEWHPALSVYTHTNASAFSRTNVQAIADCVSELRISINAATRATYERLMPPLKFDDLLAKIALLVAARQKSGSRLQIGFHFVAYDENIHELPHLPDLANSLGIADIAVAHCEFYHDQRVDVAQSLFHHRERYNQAIRETRARCERLGIRLSHPPAFIPGVARPRGDCNAPWTSLYVDHNGQTYTCCDVEFDSLPLPKFSWQTSADFHAQVWNDPAYVRLRAGKSAGTMPECRACLTVDRTDASYLRLKDRFRSPDRQQHAANPGQAR